MANCAVVIGGINASRRGVHRLAGALINPVAAPVAIHIGNFIRVCCSLPVCCFFSKP